MIKKNNKKTLVAWECLLGKSVTLKLLIHRKGNSIARVRIFGYTTKHQVDFLATYTTLVLAEKQEKYQKNEVPVTTILCKFPFRIAEN